MPARSIFGGPRLVTGPEKRNQIKSGIKFGVQLVPDIRPERKSAANYFRDAL